MAFLAVTHSTFSISSLGVNFDFAIALSLTLETQ